MTAPRPQPRDLEVRRRAAEAALPAVTKWFGPDCPSRDEIIEDLISTFDRAWIDGYDICRHLEKEHGWMPDAELVGIFDNPYVIDAKYDAVRNWVRENNMVPQSKIGDEISFRFCGARATGPIDEIYVETAIYSVTVDHQGRRSYVPVPFEEALPAVAATAEPM